MMKPCRLRTLASSSVLLKPSPAFILRAPTLQKLKRCIHQEILPFDVPPIPPPESGPIRDRLSQWHSQYGVRVSEYLGSRSAPFDKDAEETYGEGQDVSALSSDLDYWGDMQDLGQEIDKATVRPGDLVEIRDRNEDVRLAVVIRRMNTFVQAITSRGKWIQVRGNLVTWTHPNWMNPQQLEPLVQYLPVEGPETDSSNKTSFSIPTEVAGSVVLQLAQFEEKVRTLTRENSKVLDTCYDILSDKVELRYGSLSRITERLLNKNGRYLDPAALYAVRAAVMRHGSGFHIESKRERQGELWIILPKQMLTTLTTIQTWVRQYREGLTADHAQDPVLVYKLKNTPGFRNIDQFVELARRLIQEYRTLHSCPDGISPKFTPSDSLTSEDTPNGTFTKSDSLIIQFLELWCIQHCVKSELATLPSLILKSTGMYDHREDCGIAVGRLFLKEIGVIPHYFNMYPVLPALMLPCSGMSKSLEVYHEKVHSQNVILVDSMAGYRHDWGDLRVYCIDPPGSTEIDDGISIESIPEQPDHFWIRAHVANPSAFLSTSPDSPTANITSLARQIGGSLYLPDLHHPMLPSYIAEACNIAPGRPTLTFSFKIDRNGNMLEHDVRSGIVRNVVHLTYDELNIALGERGPRKSSLVVGTDRKLDRIKPDQSKLSKEDQTRLTIMKDLLIGRTRWLGKQGGIRRFTKGLGLTVWNKKDYLEGGSSGIDLLLPNRVSSQHYNGQPVIEIETSGFDNEPVLLSSPSQSDTDATTFVSTWMSLACAAAANWAWERKIPLMYRVSLPRQPVEEIVQYRHEKQQYFQNLPEGITRDAALEIEQIKQGSVVALPRPGLLISQMIPRYAKVTSPLRRYGDMMNHFQIESALRYEADTGRRFVTDGQEPRPELAKALAFSQQEVESEISRIREREYILLETESRTRRLWLLQFLHRAKHQNECAIPESFKMPLLQIAPGQKWNWVQIPFLDTIITAKFDQFQPGFAAHDGIKPLDVWEVVLDEVDTSRGRINLRPVRLLERAEGDDGWQVWRKIHKILDLQRLPPIWT